jgi:PAS domain S-box-containing protein
MAIVKRFRAWLADVPFDDPQERRNAVTVQVFGIFAIAWIAVGQLLPAVRADAEELPRLVLVVANAIIPCLALSIVLMRGGRYRAGIVSVVAGLTVPLAALFAVGGLSYGTLYLRAIAIPIAAGALLFGRRGLWSILAVFAAALAVGSLRDSGLLGGAGPRPPAPTALGALAAPVVAYAALSLMLHGLAGSLHESLGEVEEQARRWRSLLEGVHWLVVVVDREGRVEYVNPFFGTVAGVEPAALRARPLLDLVPARERAEAAEALHASAAGLDAPPRELGLVTRAGTERIVSWSWVPLRRGGAVEGVLGVGADVTERRAAEAERDEMLRQLEALRARLEEENLYLREEMEADLSVAGMVGESDALRYMLLRVGQVAASDTTVLVLGETGVGKELVARAIHERSARRGGPFVRVNCAALPAAIVESELFGHEAGAFTGATRVRKGRFELANGGTLFLDEVGELPLELQAKLLRVLQEGEFERLGSSETRRADVRVIAATNRNLKAEVAAGRFRQDLYFRLDVFPITVPPLRQRKGDVPLLVRHFVPQLGVRSGKTIREVPAPVLRALTEYEWPGNVRELRNVLERAVLQATDGVLRLTEPLVPTSAVTPVTRAGVQAAPLTLEETERLHIQRTLDLTKGRVNGPGGAAELLGINPNTLRSRMKKLGIARSRHEMS